ncbi:hypothetical protein ACYFX5_03915 [Bremerella sp. T1]|uniref:hypothetical protein n=1 Tax=Bremerella sp. TYQ1 TaxID=3119568 RepID=UPI001CCB8AAA|nr:hypothetical protein [Bremerella volcania]UBM37416.1 hypothetical protein LA756_05870 [Bremerella volcania]
MSTEPVNPLRPTTRHYAWSTLMIVIWLSFAGFTTTWFFRREWQEKVIASGLTCAPIFVALLQYLSTFRYDRQAAVLATWLNGVLGLVLFLVYLPALPAALRMFANSLFFAPVAMLLTYLVLFGVFLVNAYHHLVWSEQLYAAQQSHTLPPVTKNLTIKEVFLLLLAIGWIFGITSYGVRQGWHHVLWF